MIACPACGADTQVLDTRPSKTYAKRRRRCVSTQCGQRITTIEMITRENPRLDGDAVLCRRADLERLFQLAGSLLATATPPSDDNDNQKEPT